jgi:hypothetical protein
MVSASGELRKRAHVKMDPYAWLDLVRDQHLTAPEQAILNCLILTASFRNCEWSGCLSDLAASSGVGRNRVALGSDPPSSLERLAQRGLVSVAVEFAPNRVGAIRVDCYWRLVVPERRQQDPDGVAPNGAKGDPAIRAAFAPESRRIRAGVAVNGAVEQGPRGVASRGGSEEMRQGRHGTRDVEADHAEPPLKDGPPVSQAADEHKPHPDLSGWAPDDWGRPFVEDDPGESETTRRVTDDVHTDEDFLQDQDDLANQPDCRQDDHERAVVTACGLILEAFPGAEYVEQ